MASSTSQILLRCPGCERAYVVSEVRDDRAYVCVRCDRVIRGPERAERVFLYGGRTGDTPAPAPPRSGSGGVVAAEQTFGFDLHADGEEDAPEAPALGTIGRFQLLGELGRGGMGVVYRGWDADLDRGVAVKLLLRGGRAGQAEVERFLREARAGAQLDHPNLVRVHDIGRHDDQVFFTMDLVEGPSLADVLDEVERLPPVEAARIGARVARGVHHAHVHGLIHRDLKPGNVLLEPTGRPLVTDFGLVKSLGGEDDTLTRTGQVLGTPAYMAPEQASGEGATPRSDVYALGAVLFRMLSGRAPYEGEGAGSVIVQVLQRDAPSLRTLDAGVPLDLALIVDRAMAREPERRYPSALALAEDLERYLRGDPVEARPPSAVYRARKWVRRHPAWAAGGGVIVGVVLLAVLLQGSAGLWSQRQARQREVAAAAALEAVLTRIDGTEDEEEAARLFESFVEVEQHAGTRALTRGWLAWAERAADSDDPDQQLHALGRAWLTAPDPELLGRVGLALARILRARWRFEDLDAALRTTIERVPALADDPEVRQLRLAAALGRGAMATAVERASGTPHSALVGSLAQVTRVPLDGMNVEQADLDGDGRIEVLLRRSDGRVTVHEATPSLPPLGAPIGTELPPAAVLYRVPWPGGDRLVTSRYQGFEPGERTLWELRDGALVALHRWQGGHVNAAAVADLDGSGAPEIYLGVGMGGRRILRLEEGPEGWRLEDAHPATARLNSNISSLVVADLDGDGVETLVAAASGWGAWDVRGYEQRDGSLQRVWRHRVGETLHGGVAVVDTPSGPLVAVGKARRFASRVAFPPEDRRGAPAGVYLLRPEGGGVTLDGYVPYLDRNRARTGGPRELKVGDLDGDGRDELVYVDEGRKSTAVLHQQADGSFVPLQFPRGAPFDLVQLDDDPELEMMRTLDGEVVIHGAGPVPAEAARAWVAQPPPDDVPTTLHERWRRGVELTSMGLLAAAAGAFEDIASVTPPPTSGEIWMRAGELWEQSGDLERAAAVFDEAVEELDDPEEALVAALRVRLADHRFEAARAPAAALRAARTVDDEAQALLAELDRAVDLPVVSFDFAAPLDAGWRIHRPLQVGWDRAGGLRAEVTDDEVLLSRPLEAVGGRLGVRVVADLERTEWGSGFVIGLRPIDGEGIVAVGQFTAGGGGISERRYGCIPGDGWLRSDLVRSQQHADSVTRVELWIDVVEDGARCEVVVGGGEGVRRTHPTRGLPTGPVELVLRSAGEMPDGPSMSVVLREVELVGVEERGTPTDDVFLEGARAWANGARGLARRSWSGAPRSAARDLALAVALERAQLPPRVRELVAPHLDDAALSAAVRADPIVLRLLGRLDPDLPAEVAFQSLQAALGMHRDDAWLLEVLDAVPGIDAPTTETERALRLARGQALVASGAVEPGVAELEAALEGWVPVEHPLSKRAGHVSLATRHARSGDHDEAYEHAVAAVALDAAPERMRDALRQLPEIRDLLDEPRWRELLVDGPELWVDGTERSWDE